jgi:hypothetical protein
MAGLKWMMNRARPFLLSFASGMVWSLLAYWLARSLTGTRATTSPHLATLLSGGMLASPLIGVLIGSVSRGFSRLGLRLRVLVALADLYFGAFLFLWATGIPPLVGLVFGLTLSGYFVVLWPLSYLNHTLIAAAWTGGHRAGRENLRAPGAAPEVD